MMSREEKLKAIMEMSLEIALLTDATDEEIDKLYIQTKVSLSAVKELKGIKEGDDYKDE